MHKPVIRHGFILILLALLGAMLLPAMQIPRLGLSAHTIGVLSGVLLIAIGAIWPLFRLGAAQLTLMRLSWLYSSYMNWFACLLGGFLGAGRMTPLAADGQQASAAAEALMAALFGSVALTSLVAVVLSIVALKGAGDE